MIDVFDREGRLDEVARIAQSVPADSLESASPWRMARTAGLNHLSGGAFDDLTRQAADAALRLRDGESIYFTALNLGHSGANAQAIRALRGAVSASYCSYPAMDHDPAFTAIRNTPQFQEVREAAIACQQRFVRFRSQARR